MRKFEGGKLKAVLGTVLTGHSNSKEIVFKDTYKVRDLRNASLKYFFVDLA